MITKPQTLEEILVKCAGATHVTGDVVAGERLGYVLGDEVRLPCPELRFGGKKCHLRWHDGQKDKICFVCHGRLWVPTPNLYAWRRAMRALGARLDMASEPDSTGDWVVFSLDPYVGRVGREHRLRDQLAEVTAIVRLLEQLDGVTL